MQQNLVYKVAGAAFLALVSAAGYALDIAQVANIGNKWWPLVTFSIFFILVAWIIYGLYRQNSQLLDNRPSVNVQPIKNGNIYYLQVKNDGAEGIYKAQIQIASQDPNVWQLTDYTGYWRFSNNKETKILKGQYDLLKIAELYTSSPPGPYSQQLKIWFFDESANYAHYVDTSSHWVGATITSLDGTTRSMTKNEYYLSITISTSPALRDGMFHGNFVLSFDSLRFTDKKIGIVENSLGT